MRNIRTFTLCLALSVLSALVCGSAPRQNDGQQDPPARLTVAISDLSGTDKELGAFLAETLLTDMARSTQLQPLERAEILQAFTDLQLRASSPLTPAQARQLGQQVHADRITVGSY